MADRQELVVGIEALCRGIATEFADAIPPLQHEHLMRALPEPRKIPVEVLRRLHGALTDFIGDAQAAEDAKLPRQPGGDA